ncbi:MAG TPA: nuclear transport factor 2 family protein [Pyrinomonadaceae bacterium]|nr:nuclear transport factor 2 family protein [Pyrinomonadaceae bacterium]
MKRSVITFLLVAAAFSFAAGQVKPDNSDEAEIVALEKRAFEAWKNKDKGFFEEHMAEDGQYLDLNGAGGKAQYVQVIIDNNCTVNSYALDKTKVTMLNKDAALLTYRYTYDIVCGGKPEAGPLWASTVYVRRGGKWLIAFHQELPAAPAK